MNTKCKVIEILFLFILIKTTGQITFEFNPLNLDKEIKNKGTDINFWDLNEWQNAISPGFYNTYFPFVEKVQLMAAIGGNDERDLFINPDDTSNLYDYNFQKLITACQNIINQGLTPIISLCWVPQKLSSNPFFGGFGTNVRPPKNYNLWYQYVCACLNALVSHFGIDEVRTWWWCVGVEFENNDWFHDGFSAPTTMLSFFKLYDYTVGALETVLGKDYVNVGVHSMTCANGFWDERLFIDHCAFGVNFYNDSIGNQLDFYQISYYDEYADGFRDTLFLEYVNHIKQHLELRGFANIPFGIAEGRVLYGWDNKPLGPREVLHPIQGSMDAKKIILMIENEIDWFSNWGCYMGTYNNKPVNLVGANIYSLHFKMAGSKLVEKNKYGFTLNQGNQVDGIAGYNSNENKIYLFFYNNNPDYNSTTSENVNVIINNVAYVSGSTITVKKWIVDDNNANFWTEWYNIQIANNLTDDDFIWSRYAIGPMSNNGWNVWGNNIGTLQPLSEISCNANYSDYISNNTYSLSFEIPHHGVILYEISNIKVIDLAHIKDNENIIYTNNIADRYLNVKCENGYKIFQVDGKVVIDCRSYADKIDISNLRPGLYFLNKDNTIYKIIKY